MSIQQYAACARAFTLAFRQQQARNTGRIPPDVNQDVPGIVDWFAYFNVETVEEATKAGIIVADLDRDICNDLDAQETK